jgi:hypothetical protein
MTTPNRDTLAARLGTYIRAAPRCANCDPDARVLMREALEALEAERWRPISEAPKDGTPFLGGCFFEDGSLEEAFPCVCESALDGQDPHWTSHGLTVYPTHFAPLPAPPTHP